MREIKFRAWDNVKNKMWSAEEMGRDELTMSVDGRGFCNPNPHSTKLTTYLTHFIPMQYTGLKDRNGKEVYDGDVARFNDSHGVSTKTGYRFYVVSWDAEFFCWDFIPIDRIKKELPEFGPGFIPTIIGNIHQNPELLEVTHA